MAKFIIHGGRPLRGAVRLGGAKNASFKLMIASLLAKGESRLLNFSRIEDVGLTGRIIMALGGSVRSAGERTLFVNGARLCNSIVPVELGLASRASTMFLPVLLHRLKRARVPLPGGDRIGHRPLDRHFDGLMQMGARIEIQGNTCLATASRLCGTTYRFTKNTHTGTETLIMAAVLAEGKTRLLNCGLEPEIDDMITFLTMTGARIRRQPDRVIEITGVPELHPVIYRVMPDRNEAVSYAVAALCTRGDIILENARPHDLKAFLRMLRAVNGGYEIGAYGMRFFYQGKLKKSTVITAPHPGFMTDWQPLWAVLATQAHGTSTIVETIHPFRFQYAGALQKMGAKIQPFDPQPRTPGQYYNFDEENDRPEYYHGIRITGPVQLTGVNAQIPDLRAGATMVLAALAAHGRSVIGDIAQIDRGYENLDGRLQELGAEIRRIN